MKFGYARVSTTEQNLDRQIDALIAEGIEEKNIFTDKVSGVKEDRQGLNDLLSRLREGDSVTILSFDRLARSTKQLLDYCEAFREMGVDLISLHENIDSSSPQGYLFFTISAAFAEFQRTIQKQAQAEGYAAAKAKGKKMGRPRGNSENLEAAITLYIAGNHSISEIEKTTSVSRSSLYRELGIRGIDKKRCNNI